MSSDLQAVVRPEIDISRERESNMVRHALDLMNTTRKDMGWTAPGIYERDSWLWKRHIAMRQYEDDFRHRLLDPRVKLWQASNRSFNMVSMFIDQDKARLTKDLEADRFFALTQEGEEDAHPALRPAERYLQKRAKKQCLADKLTEDGILGALIRGEAVYKAIPARRTCWSKRKARLVLDERGQAAKDSRGNVITEFDQWVPNPLNPRERFLARDRSVKLTLANPTVELPLSPDAHEVPVVEAYPAGSDISFPFWADLIIPLTACDLDAALIRGHVFEMRVDELYDTLPNHLLNSDAAQRYYKEAWDSQGGDRPDSAQPSLRRGELEDGSNEAVLMEGVPGLNTYAELYFRYDADGDQRREDLMLLVDVAKAWPIAYGRAQDVLQDQNRTHPFDRFPLRVFPVPHRWYGRGYYQKDHDLAESVDADLNRLEIEKAKSGNVIIENPQATEEGRAGLPIIPRSPKTYKLAGGTGADASDVVKVITIQPQTREIEQSMEKTQSTLFARRGSVTPGETEGAGLQGANTATGLQILREAKHESVEARDKELKRGTTQLLLTFAELELRHLDRTALENQLKGDVIPQPGIDPTSQQPVTVQMPSADVVAKWAAEISRDDLTDVFRIIQTRSRGKDIIANNDNILKVIEKWEGLAPQARLKLRPIFVEMLAALEVNNPNDYLETAEELQQMIEAEMMAAEAAMAAEQAAGPGGTPQGLPDDVAATAQAATEPPPITGRPETMTPQPEL